MAVRMQEMSKTYQYRKVMKPLLERKRRARINKCLDELKDLMSECLVQQGENVVRLEKADILELTVDHLKRLRGKVNTTNVNNGISNDNHHSFRSGYVHAANEVSRALACYPGVDIFLGTKVMAHLGHRLIQIEKQKHNHHEINNITKSSSSSSLPVNSPLRVYCGNNNNNSGQKIDQNDYVVRNENYTSTQNNQQLSPVSSGYGSDNESVSPSVSSLSNNYHNYEDNNISSNYHHHQGLLKIANPTIMPIETSTKDIWRPW